MHYVWPSIFTSSNWRSFLYQLNLWRIFNQLKEFCGKLFDRICKKCKNVFTKLQAFVQEFNHCMQP